ncbi:MAG: hypothetical protein K0S22_905 [Oscillospiraceae bacterium]|jgi:hypothetical protein|nr:hypothetical protein [Oscillospiraceae bacterium]
MLALDFFYPFFICDPFWRSTVIKRRIKLPVALNFFGICAIIYGIVDFHCLRYNFRNKKLKGEQC